MADQEGYIKIDRNILRWGWYKDIKTCHLFIHLLIRANYKDCVFMGCKIKRGQLAASCGTLADESGMTIDEIRTGLKHLISTGEVTTQRRSKFLVITILNYNAYQSLPDQFPNTSRTLPDHFPITSRQEKESKEIKKGKKGKNSRSAPDSPSTSRSGLPDRDEGRLEDIPIEFRDGTYGNFTAYADYWDWRNQ